MTSWFSVESTMAIYNGFLDLDLDQSGMLNEVCVSRHHYGYIAQTSVMTLTALHHEMCRRRWFDIRAVGWGIL